jgi:hypothetical protein
MSGLVSTLSLHIICAALLLGVRPANADQAPEYEVKAGFLFNFTKFVTWPPEAFPSPNSPLVIGILGEDPFGQAFDASIAGENAQGRPIRVRRISRIEEALPGCQVLFISHSEERNLADKLQALAAVPILTVGDDDDFVALGGIIQFFLDQNRVRFAINLAASRRAGLKISSQLLRLARVVPD